MLIFYFYTALQLGFVTAAVKATDLKETNFLQYLAHIHNNS